MVFLFWIDSGGAANTRGCVERAFNGCCAAVADADIAESTVVQ